MAQKPKIGIPQKVTLLFLAKARNSPADWAREMFKPSKTREVLYFRNKKILSFGFGVFGCWHHYWDRFYNFFDDIIDWSNEMILWLKALLDSSL